MKKESIIYHTHEILTDKIKKQSNIFQKLVHYIKDDNYKKFVETLKDKVINPDARDINGMSLLSYAVNCSCINIVKYLLAISAEVNTQDVLLFNLEIYEYPSTLCTY